MKQGLAVALQVPALAHPEIRGTVSTVIPFSDPASHSFVVQVDIPATAGLQEGQYAKGRFVVGAAERILVPAKALVSRGQLTGVYWIDPERTARFRLVRTGNAEGENIEVLSGLRAGDRYVVEPGVQIADGMKVEGVS
jgi:multidrug efflux pump subunit AcrA (membrane-fusion protein)